MVKLLILLTFISGCAVKNNFSGKGFESSNSLCLDATLVNMDADGCLNIVVQKNEEHHIMKFFCDDEKVDGNSVWLTHNFYATATVAADNVPLPGMPMCVDPNFTMSFELK